MKKTFFLSLLLLLMGTIFVSAQKEGKTYLGASTGFTYDPDNGSSFRYGIVIEKEFASQWSWVTGANVESFNKTYNVNYLNIPLYVKWRTNIVNLQLGADLYSFIGFTNPFPNINTLYYTYSFTVSGGMKISKDITLNDKIVFEPYIEGNIFNPIFNYEVNPTFGAGVKLKYQL